MAAAGRASAATPELTPEERRFEQQYALEDKTVGEGTYGAVFKGRCRRTGRTVAVKRMKPEHEEEGVPSTAIREVAVLKNADHPNVVRLLDVFCRVGKMQLVFEFVDFNLKEYMRRRGPCLPPADVRKLQFQLMSGIDYCHAHRILHRDLKPQNILVEDGTDKLKIADFGMARAFSIPLPVYTHEVVTTWYRAPEILFGSQEYSLPVDNWSAGCILGEMATGAALFRGDSEIDTIFQIFRKLGTPSEAEWPGLAKLPDFKMSFPQWKRRPWTEIRNTVDQLGVDGVLLLDGLLVYDPRQRLSARQALAHQYFAECCSTPSGSSAAGDVRKEEVRTVALQHENIQNEDIAKAIDAVRQALCHQGVPSEWTSALAAVFVEPSHRSAVLQSILQDFGWLGRQFVGPPDLQGLLHRLEEVRYHHQPQELQLTVGSRVRFVGPFNIAMELGLNAYDAMGAVKSSEGELMQVDFGHGKIAWVHRAHLQRHQGTT